MARTEGSQEGLNGNMFLTKGKLHHISKISAARFSETSTCSLFAKCRWWLGYRLAPCSWKKINLKTGQSATVSKHSWQQSSLLRNFVIDISESLSDEAGAPRTRALSAKSVTCIGYWNIRTLLTPQN